MKRWLFIFALFAATSVHGQGANFPPSNSGGGTPCTTTALSIQYNSAGLFGCIPDLTFSSPHTLTLGASGIFAINGTLNGSFTLGVANGGSGLATFTSNFFYKGNGASALAVSLFSDNGTTATYSGAGGLALTNAAASLAIGSAPPSCTAGTGFFQCGNEGTIPSPGPASGVDVLWNDSTKHCVHGNFNNVDTGCIQYKMQFCGTTSTCSATNEINWQIVIGSAPLVTGTPSTVTITGISPAFTSSTSYKCSFSDQTAVATALFSVTYVSGSSFTITGGTALTDVVGYQCVGF